MLIPVFLLSQANSMSAFCAQSHPKRWWHRIQSEKQCKDERSYQWEVNLLKHTFQWIWTKLKNVVDIRSLGWLLKRSIFQYVNSSLSTWLYLTLSPVPSMSAEIGNHCHMTSASQGGQRTIWEAAVSFPLLPLFFLRYCWRQMEPQCLVGSKILIRLGLLSFKQFSLSF